MIKIFRYETIAIVVVTEIIKRFFSGRPSQEQRLEEFTHRSPAIKDPDPEFRSAGLQAINRIRGLLPEAPESRLELDCSEADRSTYNVNDLIFDLFVPGSKIDAFILHLLSKFKDPLAREVINLQYTKDVGSFGSLLERIPDIKMRLPNYCLEGRIFSTLAQKYLQDCTTSN